jgi:hypothetical protein
VTSEQPALDALGHLRQAILEMVEVARCGLDLVEDVVADPRIAAAVAAALARLAAADPAARPREGRQGAEEDGSETRRRPPVQRIPIS